MRISDWSSDVCSSDLSYRRSGRLAVGADRARHVRRSFRGGVRDRQELHRHGAAPRFTRRAATPDIGRVDRSEEHTSELQSLMRISYAVFCLKKKLNKMHQIVQILMLRKHTIKSMINLLFK